MKVPEMRHEHFTAVCLKGRGERCTTKTKTCEGSVDAQSERTNESSKVFPQLQFTNESRSEVQLKMSLLTLSFLSVQL